MSLNSMVEARSASVASHAGQYAYGWLSRRAAAAGHDARVPRRRRQVRIHIDWFDGRLTDSSSASASAIADAEPDPGAWPTRLAPYRHEQLDRTRGTQPIEHVTDRLSSSGEGHLSSRHSHGSCHQHDGEDRGELRERRGVVR
jgi:hypothetical protein